MAHYMKDDDTMPVSNIISRSPPSQSHNKSFSRDLAAAAPINSSSGLQRVTAYRPRLLYSALFAWNTVTTGKFIAPFLEYLAPNKFGDGVVGMTLAAQYAIVACFAGWGGRLADLHEKRCLQEYQQRHNSAHDSRNNNHSHIKSGGGNSGSWGIGRLKVLSFSVLLGTCAVLGHTIPSQYTIFIRYELAWHIAMRCIYALSLAIMAPCIDGLALAHLDCIDDASQADFGKERMYGAAFWGLGSLCTGIGIDTFGFGFLYVMTVITAILSYGAIGLYLYGLRRDTTGAFVSIMASSLSIPSLPSLDEEEDWSGHCRDGNHSQIQSQRHRHHRPSNNASRDIYSSTKNDEIEDETTMQLFSLICRTGYGKALLFFVFTLAIGISIVDNLAFIFFDSLGSSNTINGLTVVLTVVFEVPIFYLAPRFLQHHSPGKLLLAAGLAYIVRVIGYTLAPHMSVVLLLETLHGVSYAGGKAASVEYIAQIVPRGFEATGQGLLIFVNYVGIVVGLFAGGHIQETLGPRDMFQVMATIVGIGCVVLFLAEICLETPTKRGGEEGENCGNKGADESTSLLVKSDSACSGSSYADKATENFMRKNLKYDSLNKYVKDW